MADQIPNRLAWSEVVGCMPLSDRQIVRGAKNRFSPNRFVSNKNQATRNLFKKLFETIFEVSFLDLGERVAEVFRDYADENALRVCTAKLGELRKEGWSRWSGEQPSMTLGWSTLSIQLTPHATLTRDDQICLLYAYHRRSPPFNKDAIRALLYLVRLLLKEDDPNRIRIVILDCYKDESWEGADFASTEPWISRRTAEVVASYAAAYQFYLDNNPPPSGSADVGRSGLTRLDVTRSVKPDDNNQLSLRLT